MVGETSRDWRGGGRVVGGVVGETSRDWRGGDW